MACKVCAEDKLDQINDFLDMASAAGVPGNDSLLESVADIMNQKCPECEEEQKNGL